MLAQVHRPGAVELVRGTEVELVRVGGSEVELVRVGTEPSAAAEPGVRIGALLLCERVRRT